MAEEFVTTLKEHVQAQKLGKELADLRLTLEGARLTDAQRTILADPELFSRTVLEALADGVTASDTETFAFRVLEKVDSLDDELAAAVVDAWAKRKLIDLASQAATRDRLIQLFKDSGAPIDASTLDATLDRLYQQVLQEGRVPEWVKEYLNKEVALKDRFGAKVFNGDISGGMIRYLIESEVFPKEGDPGYDPAQITLDVKSGEYDEFLGPAYQEARRRRNSTGDPIEVFRTKGVAADWNYQVDYFETAEEQGILPDNIRRAGAIDYVYWLGDVLGAYRIADAIVLGYGRGQVDIASASTSTKLYRYLKLREERSSIEERFMLYKRVLNRGDGRVLQGVIVNEQFPVLWHRLMSEIARFIEKSEEAKDSVDQVSATRIVQAVTDLQYNLTDYSTGLADMQIKEMYGHLQDAFEIAGDSEILDHFAGGRRKNVWTVFERVAREQLEVSLNVSALRTVAVEGNRIFNFVADFQPSERLSPFRRSRGDLGGNFERLGLAELVESAERWIVAANELEGVNWGGGEGEEDEEEADLEAAEEELEAEADWNA
jgi:hypothetical protein